MMLRLLICLKVCFFCSCVLLLCVLLGPGSSRLLALVLYLAFWMGHMVVTLFFVLSGSGFVFFAGTCLLGRLLDLVHDGCPGPLHALVASARRIGFHWDPSLTGWDRPGLPGLSFLAGPIRHFRSAILSVWRGKVAADLCARSGFRGGPLLDISGSHQLLNSTHVRERDKALLP